MPDTRRRRLAWLFALVLLMELALLCCAYGHLCDHCCPGCDDCAICRVVRLGARRFALPAAAAAAALACVAHAAASHARPCFIPVPTPIARKVRLND